MLKKILQVRRHCDAGLDECRAALEASGGDVWATIKRLKTPEQVRRDAGGLLTRSLCPENASGPPTEAERELLAYLQAPEVVPEAPEVRAAREAERRRGARAYEAAVAEGVLFAPGPDERAAALWAEALAAREPCAVLTLEVRRLTKAPMVPASFVADALARAARLSMIGGGWQHLDIARAQKIVAWLLGRSLVWGTPLLPDSVAEGLGGRFFALFDGPLECLTNATWGEDERPKGWLPLTNATFDAAVVVLDGAKAGLVCVAEED